VCVEQAQVKQEKKKKWSPNKREKNKCKKIGVYIIGKLANYLYELKVRL
jgi:hypothetical protein